MPAPEDRRYEHRFHAGNVGDVLKHTALTALLGALPPGPKRLIETHAGAGAYPLGATGEWTEGIGRVWSLDSARAPESVERYLREVEASTRRRRGSSELAGGAYPGSPLIFASMRGEHDRLVLHEIADEARAAVSARFAGAPWVEVVGEDGLAALSALSSRTQEEIVVLIDPPYADRREWTDVARAIIAAHGRAPAARMMLWYPIKSYARPNALLGELERAQITAATVELITTPLTSQKNRLNGSGVLFVSPPDGLVEEMASCAAWLGPRLATQAGRWSTRCVGFGSR